MGKKKKAIIKTLIFIILALFVVQTNVFAQTKEEADDLYDKGMEFFDLQDYNNAIYYFKEAIIPNENYYGKNHPCTSGVYFFLGISYERLRDFENAIYWLEKSYNADNASDSDKSIIANTLTWLGNVHYDASNYDEAIKYHQKELEIRKLITPETDNNYGKIAMCYANIGLSYEFKEDYQTALSYFEQALEIRKKVFGENSIEVANSYRDIGVIFYKYGNYFSGIEFFNKAFAIKTSILEEDHPEVVVALYDMACCYRAMQKYSKALDLCKQVEALYIKNKEPFYSESFAALYGQMSDLYSIKGNKNLAIEYLEKSLEINIAVYGEKNPRSANIFLTLGNHYKSMGDNSRARANIEHAISIQKEIFGNSETTLLASCYQALASMERDIDKALEMYKHCCDIYTKFVAEKNLGLVECYTSMARLYCVKDDFVMALDYYAKADEMLYDIYGCVTKNNAEIYAGAADIFVLEKDYENAKSFYKSSIDIYKELFGENSVYAAEDPLPGLAHTYAREGDIENALKYYKEAYKGLKNSKAYHLILVKLKNVFNLAKIYHYDTNTDFMRETLALAVETVEKARLDMNSRKDELLRDALDFYYHGVALEATANNGAKAFEYSEMLRSRGFLEQLGTERAMYLDGVTDKERAEIKSLSDEITNTRETIDYQVNLTLDKRDAKTLSNAEKKLNESEKALKKLDDAIAKRLPVYGELRNPQPAKLKDAQKWCGKKRAILEYVLYEPQEEDAEPFAYCIVLTNKKITTVKLNANFDFSSKVSALRDAITKRPLKSEVVFEDVRNELYAELVEPVLPYIDRNIKNLMIVPDGNLAFLPFDILRKDADADDLGKKYNISISPSVSVSMLDKSNNTTKNILAFGGSWYDATLSESEHDEVLRGCGTRGQDRSFASVTTNTSLTEQDLRNLIEQNGSAAYFANKKLHWQDLPGTIYELEELKKGAFKNATVQTQKTASEAVLKEFSKSKKLGNFGVLHFACHGYFDPDLAEMSSVLFSEVSGKLDNSIEDGYLTIGEASSLNLNADMVCLSACQTGLGKTQKGEGMIGLSRAFMVAGAKNVGVTLWSVDDSATAEFMKRMYTKVSLGMTYEEAYRKVKNEFRNSDDYSHPYYWAAFCLYE